MERKFFRIGLLIVPVLVSLTCCTFSKPKTLDEVRVISFGWLSEEEKESIVDWESAAVETIQPQEELLIMGLGGTVDLKGKEVYKITFQTDMDALLGPFAVYMDRKTYEKLGVGLRF